MHGMYAKLINPEASVVTLEPKFDNPHTYYLITITDTAKQLIEYYYHDIPFSEFCLMMDFDNMKDEPNAAMSGLKLFSSEQAAYEALDKFYIEVTND